MSMTLMTKAAYARDCGVVRSAIDHHTRPGGQLEGAIVDGKVDLTHPNAVSFLEKRAGGSDAEQDITTPTAQEMMTGGVDLEKLQDLTVREVVMRFGNIQAFKTYVESLKNIADYQTKEVNLRKLRGELVEKVRVKQTVMAYLDVANTRLVSDVPIALSKKVVGIVEAGGAEMLQDVEKEYRAANSQVLKSCKKQINDAEVMKR